MTARYAPRLVLALLLLAAHAPVVASEAPVVDVPDGFEVQIITNPVDLNGATSALAKLGMAFTFPANVNLSTVYTNATIGNIFSVTNGTLGQPLIVGPNIVLVEVSASGPGQVTVTIPADKVFDPQSKGNAETVFSYTYQPPPDLTPPTVSIAAAGATGGVVVPITFTFSEDVTGFDATDVTVTGGTLGNFTATSAQLYTADVTRDGSALTVEVAAGAAQDGASNASTAATPFTLPPLSFSGSGSGTAGDPYQITTVAELNEVRFDLAAHYLLMNDLDLAGTPENDEGGDGWTPIGSQATPFSGSFDGDGHTIAGLFIDKSGVNYIGLFGNVNQSATITDLGLAGVDVTGGDYTGGLAGEVNGTIRNSYSTGSVSGSYVGGLAGINSGTIQGSYTTGSVTSTNGGGGGLVGYNGSGSITDSYSRADVSGVSPTGGLAGLNVYGATITNSYSAGSVPSGGGLVGSTTLLGVPTSSPGSTINSFWDKEASGTTASAGGTGKTTVQMQTRATFTDAGWDFAGYASDDGDTWSIDASANDGYPVLTWQGLVNIPVFSGAGSGTAGDPYQITTVKQLDEVRHHLAAHFLLMNDLDLAGTPENDESGDGWTPIGSQATPFSGSFDGDGHTIAELFINRGSAGYVGLFGYVDAAGTITDLGLAGVDVTGQHHVGGLVGYHEGTLTNSYSTGTVSGTSHYVGGLTGMNGGTITGSYTTGTVAADQNTAGGLVGYNTKAISDSYSRADVSGGTVIGGLAGVNEFGTIANSYSTGHVQADQPNSVGGLVASGGPMGFAGTATNAFWDTETSGTTTSVGGTGQTTAQMTTRSTFTNAGWDFLGYANDDGDTWDIGPAANDGYPVLTWQGLDTTIPFSGAGSGTADDPYQITTVKQLDEVRHHLAAHFLLMNDLDLAGTPENDESGDGWAPIGSQTTPFTGSFDGGGHTIAGLFIENTASDIAVGLFGFSGGTITDLGLTDVDVTGHQGVGALVGFSQSTISGSYVTGSVAGEQGVGGLVGMERGTITDSYSTAAVSGATGVGGLVGATEGTINSSFSVGTVTATDSYVGGLVGSIESSQAAVNNSYSRGDVIGSSIVGGLAGSNQGAISDSYSTGAVPATGTSIGGLIGQDDGGSVVASFWDTETSGAATSAGGTGQTTAQMTTRSTFTNAGWDFLGYANDDGDTWDIGPAANDGYPVLTWQGLDTTIPFSGAGSGTADDPYQITTVKQLDEVRHHLAAHFLLMNDLDLAGTPENDESGDGWAPIGSQTTPFTGSFDGGGHTIAGLFIEDTASDISVGLFGRTSNGGAITDVGVTDAEVTGKKYVGILAGYSGAGDMIRGSYTTGTVAGSGSVGGLVGYSEGAEVRDSYSHATVTGASGSSFGGLIGQTYEGTVSGSYSAGAVDGASDVGGLIGSLYKTQLDNSYSTSAATGQGNVGGLAGSAQFGVIRNSYSTGAVTGGNQYTGGLFGYYYSNDPNALTGVFWDTETSNQTTSPAGTGKTTAEMTTRSTFTGAGWDFVGYDSDDGDTWRHDAALHGGYPFLTWQYIAPGVGGLADTTIDEDDAAELDFTIGAVTDLSGLTLTVASGNTDLVPAAGLVLTGTGADRALTVTPAADSSGTATLTVTVDDGTETTSTSFLLTVSAVNDAPAFTEGADQTVDEDAGAQSVPGWATAISAGPPDEAGQTLTFTVTTDHDDLFAAGPAVASDGTLTFTPAADANGTATVTVTLQDDGGTASGGEDTVAHTFTLTVDPVNDTPVVSVPASVAIDEDAAVTFSTATNNAITITDVDAGTSPVEVTLTATSTVTLAQTTGLTFQAGDGTADALVTFTGPLADVNAALDGLTYQPSANQTQGASLQIDVSDQGHTGSGGAQTATATINVTVSPVNDPPTISDVADQATAEDTPTAELAFSVSDPETDAGSLTVTATSSDEILLPAAGVVFGGSGAGRTVTLSPAPNAHGTVTVTLTVSDGALQASDTFLLTVTPANDAPVPGGNVVETEAGLPVAFDPRLNDNDPDGDALGLVGLSAPEHGTAEIVGDAFSPEARVRYTPAADFSGTDTFTYTLSDGNGAGGMATGSVTVHVLAAADEDNVAGSIEDGVPTPGGGFGDGNGDGTPDREQATVASLPSSGEEQPYVTLELPYGGAQNLAFVDVRAVERPAPEHLPERLNLPLGALSFNIVGLQQEEEPDTTTVRIFTDRPVNTYWKYGPTPGEAAAHWYPFLFDEATGTGAVIHPPGATADNPDRTMIVLHFRDGERGDADLTANGTITDPGAPAFVTNSLPAAADDAAATDEDTARTIDVLANDTDADGDALVLVRAGTPAHGTAALADGEGGAAQIRYTPAADFSGTDTFTYTVADAFGGTATATVTVTVASVNDAPRFEAPAILVPADSAEVRVGGRTAAEAASPSELFVVEWPAAVDPEGDAVTYTWRLAADAAFEEVLAEEVVEAQRLALSLGTVARLLDGAGVMAGASVDLFHQVVASDGTASIPSRTSMVRLVRGTLVGLEREEGLPADYALAPNYPNPFNPATVIPFALPAHSEVHLAVYNMLGQEVAVLADEALAPGRYRMEWRAEHQPSGVYVVRLKAGAKVLTRTVVLMK